MSTTARAYATLALALTLLAPVFSWAQQPAAPSPDQKAMMDAWMKYSTPGEAHEHLASTAGTWDVKVSSWMQPGAPPETSTATSEIRSVLGGRYVEERFHGEMMGQPFDGIGYTGYDNYKKQFVGTWIDSMSTALMVMTAPAPTTGNTVTFTGTMDDVMTGKPAKIRMVVTHTDADHHRSEMYAPGPDGKEYKTLDLQYTRRK